MCLDEPELTKWRDAVSQKRKLSQSGGVPLWIWIAITTIAATPNAMPRTDRRSKVLEVVAAGALADGQ
jgi:hypothetical protein